MLTTFLLGLLLCAVLAFAATMVLHLVILRVPYVPTSSEAAVAMVKLAGLTGGETVVDLGAGDGRLLLHTRRTVPGVRSIGVELVPTVWLLGWLRTRRARRAGDVTWILGNALTADVRSADVVYLYVAPHLMATLEDKFDRELRPGTVVIANTFSFPRRRPEAESRVGSVPIRRYVW